MAPAVAVIVLFLVCVSVVSETSDCSRCNTEVATLKAQLLEAQAELVKGKDAGQCQSFSVLEVGSKAWALGGNAANHVLSQTEIDEKVTNMAADAFSKGRVFTAGVVDKVSALNYSTCVQDLKSHPVYVSSIAPHVDKAMASAQPHIDQHVAPALEKASAHLAPAMKIASEKYAKASDVFHTDVLPKLKIYRAHAFEKHTEAQSLLDQRLLSPLFDMIARMVPEHAASLPSGSLDRVLFVLASVFVLYHMMFFGLRMFVLAFWALRVCFKLTWKVFAVLVLLPVRVCLKIINFSLWIGTGFYCCGLCKSKSKASKLSDAASKSKDNGKKEADKKGDNDVKDATMAEITTLLENAKKEKKLEAAAKQLAGLVKSGKAMSTPKAMANKKVTKDVLTKACAKFKEIDIKKFGL